MIKAIRILFVLMSNCSMKLKSTFRNPKSAILVGVLLFALCLPVQAQQPKRIPRIGRLSPISASASLPIEEAFQRGLRELGYYEGKNISIEYRYADGNRDRLDEFAAELVRLKVDLIFAGSTQGARAAKNATSTIPIVMVTTGDPVASGLVASLARPGGNITGLTALSRELSGKRLEVLREAVPAATRVGVLSNPSFEDTGPSLKGVEIAARALGVQLRTAEIREPAEFDKAFATMTEGGARALMVLNDTMFDTYRDGIVDLAAKSRLPAMYGLRGFIDAGGLMFYGASLPDMYYQSATYVDKILRGTKPGDLPVTQPTKFELIINLKTAKQIGLTIPPNVLARADRVLK
jgi:putative ABC transport system substrate-binding protein